MLTLAIAPMDDDAPSGPYDWSNLDISAGYTNETNVSFLPRETKLMESKHEEIVNDTIVLVKLSKLEELIYTELACGMPPAKGTNNDSSN
jgi:hypothetical protein